MPSPTLPAKRENSTAGQVLELFRLSFNRLTRAVLCDVEAALTNYTGNDAGVTAGLGLLRQGTQVVAGLTEQSASRMDVAGWIFSLVKVSREVSQPHGWRPGDSGVAQYAAGFEARCSARQTQKTPQLRGVSCVSGLAPE